ncbi:MAG: Wzz/FepE/Etk N-terminal domain-containing protein [Oscillospiraceae bacterium]|nr:Wzz/FepE/Etk N-terminal domain-containing protein [Oscillospiraceae bacterium]
MERGKNKDSQHEKIDVLELFITLFKKAWIIAISTVLAGLIVGGYAFFFVPPKYQASAMLYVNNNSVSVAGTSFDLSDLNAAKSLVSTYSVILHSRNVLDDVIEESGVDYSYNELNSMITAAPVDSTEIFRVVVTSTNPDEAELIANSICSILPKKISSIVESSSVRIVDFAVRPESKSSPNITMYALVGMIVGFVISCVVIVILKLFDNSINGEDYLINNYKYPVLGVIPDFDDNHQKNKYYSYSKERGDYGDA